MCRHASSTAKVLENRQRGLDARGNNPANTRAESTWAVQTLQNLDQEAVHLVSEDIKKLNDQAQQLEGLFDKEVPKPIPTVRATFNNGCQKIFGKYLDGEPKPRELVSLMLEDQYGFKLAADAVKSDLAKKHPTVYNQGKGLPEFKDRGRVQGPKRKGSFSNPDAGITDRVYRDSETRDFFATNVSHAKGTLEGQPKSDIYQMFLDQGAPFIGGASGTMHGLVVGIELEKQKRIHAGKEVPDDPEEKRKRETLIGVYMATLVAGGHHSVSECLIAAKGYGYFEDITHPLFDYPRAMQELGTRLQQLGLSSKLTAEAPVRPGDPWREAFERAWTSLLTLQDAIEAAYRRRDLDAGPLIRQFRNSVGERIKQLFPEVLADKLDEMAAAQDDNARRTHVDQARVMIEQLQTNLKDSLLGDLDTNPFVPLAIRETLSGTLDRLSKGVVGSAPGVSSEPSGH